MIPELSAVEIRCSRCTAVLDESRIANEGGTFVVAVVARTVAEHRCRPTVTAGRGDRDFLPPAPEAGSNG